MFTHCSRLFRHLPRYQPPPPGVVTASKFRRGGKIEVDVCIVTNCAFAGGNASSTLTELEQFLAQGLSCVIVHCPVKRSPWKRYWVAERYLEFSDHIVPSHAVRALKCRSLIVRGPRMAMTPTFKRLAKRIDTQQTIFVANNSAWSENGKPVFSWDGLHRRIAEIGLPQSRIYPVGPVVRLEAETSMAEAQGKAFLAADDWPPAFKLDAFPFKPKSRFQNPIVVGRHGRDHDGKWLEDPKELQRAYPDRSNITVSILGGANVPRQRLGALPDNWVVKPFGASTVVDYLSQLDVFVYFPSWIRDEAFGRTIIEANLCGVPVVLPPAFRTTFGDLAIYCHPDDVSRTIDRLSADDKGRLHYLEACRREASRRFGAHTLSRRLEMQPVDDGFPPVLDEEARKFRKKIMAPV